jgi:uncharacterized protein (TIRG00374 family)
VLGFLRRLYSFFQSNALARLIFQLAVSAGLIAMLVAMAQQANIIASVRSLRLESLALALGLLVFGFALNSWRWQMLLANAGVQQRLRDLTALYFIGLFFSLFLPTGTGGDIVRTYDVGRRSGRFPQAILGTLQERVLGFGVSLLIGLVAAIYYLPLVPVQLRIWMILIQVAGAAGVAVLLYPVLLFRIAGRIGRAQGHRLTLRRIVERPLVVKIVTALRQIEELPPLPVARLCLLVGISIAAVLMGIGMYYVIGQSLGIQAGLMAFCLVVPLVWIVRMAPVSLNGIGVGEGAFVFMMGLFAAPADKALVLALAILGLQTLCALFGGLLLALRMARGTWRGVRPSSDNKPVGEIV